MTYLACRGSLLSLFALAIVTALGCSAPAEGEPDDEVAEGALAEGEAVVEHLVQAPMASGDPKVTGVDVWDYALVQKDGEEYFVASGFTRSVSAGRTSLTPSLDVVTKGKEVFLRSPIATQAVTLTPERVGAIAADFKRLESSLAAEVAGGTRPLTHRTRCKSLVSETLITTAITALGAAATYAAWSLPVCAVGAVVTLGVGTVVCGTIATVGLVAASGGALVTSLVAAETVASCVDGRGQ